MANCLAEGVRDTIIMTAVATLLAYVIGLPIGVLLITSAKKGIRPNAPLNTVLGWIVNIVRSVPFIILLVAIIPLTRLIVGTSLGVPGAIVPLVITAAPFVARVVEQSLAEVDGSLVEAAQSFGASNLQIVFKVLLFESLPSLVRGAALTFITLFGFSAMAGTVGAGGLAISHPLRLPALPVRRDDRCRDPVRHSRADRADHRRRGVRPYRPSRALSQHIRVPYEKRVQTFVVWTRFSYTERDAARRRLLVELGLDQTGQLAAIDGFAGKRGTSGFDDATHVLGAGRVHFCHASATALA